jgi:hypothetical protein
LTQTYTDKAIVTTVAQRNLNIRFLRNWAFTCCLLAAFLFMCGIGVSVAQLAGKGGINGRVTDTTGAVVAGASVEITQVQTNVKRAFTTTGAGEYSFSLEPGKYVINVSHAGFRSLTQENVIVDALQTYSIDLHLAIGDTTETLTVSAAPPTLETSNATLGVTMEQEQYSALPLIQDGGSQRRATDFAQLLPGVNSQTTNGNIGTNGGSVNGSGSRGAVSAIYIDGVPITSVGGEGDPRFVWTSMAVDAINQFQVQTVGYAAIYEGQGVQNYVVKNGTNQVHGALYDYFRDTGLDSWGFQKTNNPLTGLPQKPTEHQHEYGLFMGFPILKNKLFVFGGYEGYRFGRQVPYQLETIPTALMRQGNFSEQLVAGADCNSSNAALRVGCIYDPNTTTYNGTAYVRTPFPNNTIPMSRLSPAALKMQSLLPPPTTGGISNNYVVNYKTGLSNWTTTNRVDYTINNKQAISVVLAWGRQATTAPGAVSISSTSNGLPPPFGSTQQFTPKTKVFLFEHTYAISSRVTNQLKYGYGRYQSTGYNQSIAPNFSATANGLSGLPAGQATDSFPTVSFAGNSTINRWAGYSSNQNTANGYVLIDNVQWNVGRHSLTVGGQLVWMQYNFLSNATGVNPLQLSFSNTATAGYNGNTTAIATTGQAYASYLIGAPNSGSFTLSAVPETGARFRPISGYVQDNWKVTRSLTLDIGVRYDYFPSYREVKNRFSYFDPNATSPLIGAKGALAFGGTGTGTCNCDRPVSDYFKHISPRIGFAWQIDPKTVVRGSYAILYTHGNVNGGSATARQGPGLAGYSVSPSTSFNSPAVGQVGNTYWQIDTPYPAYVRPPNLDPSLGTFYTSLSTQAAQTPTYADPYLGGRAPQFTNWSLGLQHEISRDLTLTMSYVGSEGRFLASDTLNGRGYFTDSLDPKWLSLGTKLSNPATGANGPANLASAGLAGLPYPSFGGTGNPSIAQYLRPFPQYSSISDAYGFIGTTYYHALQVYMVKRMANGLTFMTNYTWSRSIDNNGTFRAGYDIPAFASSDGKFHAARSLDKSLSLGDQRHKFVVTGVYDLPFGEGRFGGGRTVTRALFGGFRLSTIFNAYSGAPLSITMNTCNTNPAQNVCYPVLNPSYYADGKLRNVASLTSDTLGKTQYLDPNAFVRTPDYLFSASARTAPYSGLFQPGNYKLDMSLRRSFGIPMGRVHEGTKLAIEADWFNVTNHTHFVYSQSGVPLNTWGTSTYGTLVVDSNAPTNRALQLAARIEF